MFCIAISYYRCLSCTQHLNTLPICYKFSQLECIFEFLVITPKPFHNFTLKSRLLWNNRPHLAVQTNSHCVFMHHIQQIKRLLTVCSYGSKFYNESLNSRSIIGLYPLSEWMSCRQLSLSLGARLDVIMIVSLWNLTGISSAQVGVKFQSDWNSLNPNPAALRYLEILR